MKYVKYNGGTDSDYPTTTPDELKKGLVYVVVGEDKKGNYSNYTLDGVEGEFNSKWFSDLEEFLAYSYEKPSENLPLNLFKLDYHDGKPIIEPVLTSACLYINEIGEDEYVAVTLNTVYIVQVVEQPPNN